MPQVAQCSAEEESFTYRWYKTQWSRLSLNISSSHSPLDSWWCSDDMSRPPQLASSLLVSVSIILFWENIIKSICSLTRLILNCLIRLRSSEVKETIQNIILKIEMYLFSFLTSLDIYYAPKDQSEDQKVANHTYISESHTSSFFSSLCWRE